ncbi:MAG: response regulator [Deltaproteobacteria bacterium]|nr:response regulator [Deltaproteobacteria bacterium]
MKILWWSIRTQLFLLVLMITLPATGIILHDGIELQQQAVRDAHETALRVTNALAYHQERITDTTRQLLSTIAHMQDVINLDIPSSNCLLRQIHKVNKEYESFFIVNTDGRIIAATSPIQAFRVNNRKYFRDALATKDFSAGEYLTSMFSGLPALHFSYPVLDMNGSVKAIVVAELNLQEYWLFFKKSNLPTGSMMSVDDHRGIRLFHDPFFPGSPGQGLKERPITMEHMSAKPAMGTYTEIGNDGVKRLYGFRRLYLKEGGEPYIYIRTGLSEKVALAKPRRIFMRNLVFIGIILILSLVSAWFIGERLIASRLRKLAFATQVLAKGETGVHTGLSHTDGELGELAAAFDKMADDLKEQEEEKLSAEQVRQKLEMQLQHAQKMEALGTFSGGIAHDFNNILASIIGNTELTMEEATLSAEQRDCLEEVLIACTRAKDMIRQILFFSRQGEEQEREAIDISVIVKEVVKLLRTFLPTTIEIRQAITGDPAPVMTNPSQIHQIIMNLATNSAHAMREHGGVLTVQVDLAGLASGEQPSLPEGVYVRVTVSDTGTGIDPAIWDRIFDPFFTTKKYGEGTGLGLSVVYGIVKSIGGAVEVHSDLGKGARIDVYLPRCPEHGELASQHYDETGEIPGGNESVLLVDDEVALVEMGRRMLSSLGYHATAVTDSTEAYEIFRSNPESFDLLLTDMTMPNMSGMALAREVLIIRPDLPVVVCTGYAESMTTEQAKRIGVRAFVMKPLSKRDVATTLRRALDMRQARLSETAGQDESA